MLSCVTTTTGTHRGTTLARIEQATERELPSREPALLRAASTQIVLDFPARSYPPAWHTSCKGADRVVAACKSRAKVLAWQLQGRIRSHKLAHLVHLMQVAYQVLARAAPERMVAQNLPVSAGPHRQDSCRTRNQLLTAGTPLAVGSCAPGSCQSGTGTPLADDSSSGPCVRPDTSAWAQWL